MTDPCYPVIEPVHLTHRVAKHIVRHKVRSSGPIHFTAPQVKAAPQATMVGQNVPSPVSCKAILGGLPAFPDVAAAQSSTAQPKFGGALTDPAAASSRFVGGGLSSNAFAGGTPATLASLPKASLISTALIAVVAIATIPPVFNFLDKIGQQEQTAGHPLVPLAPEINFLVLPKFWEEIAPSTGVAPIISSTKPIVEISGPKTDILIAVPEPATLFILTTGIFFTLVAVRRRARQ